MFAGRARSWFPGSPDPAAHEPALELEALRRLPEAVFGVLMSLDPAIAALVGFVALGQDLGARELVAIAMVVVASAGSATLSRR